MLLRKVSLLVLALLLPAGVAIFAGESFPPDLALVRGTDGLPLLGIDCGLGSLEAGTNPQTGLPAGDGNLDTSCTWSGDVDFDGVPDPLVSDNPATFPAGTGGGFSAEVRMTGRPTGSLNGFDATLSFETKYLNAVVFDQKGLPFGDNPPPGSQGVLTLATVIDNVNGRVQLAQVILGGSAVGDVTLFRIRFDVVGAGSSALSALNFVRSTLADPSVVPHNTQAGSLDSGQFYDPLGQLNWDLSWTFSPNPEVPGSSLTLTATAFCPGCAGSLSYSWDLNNDGTSDATSSSTTLSAPPPPIIHRVTLNVSDGAQPSNTAIAVRRLPLAATINGPSTISINSDATWVGLWLGGIPSYTGTWRFCPGTSTNTDICTIPTANFPDNAPLQTNSQTLMYKFAGVYNNTLKITETLSPQISSIAGSITGFLLVNVTGSPQVFAVTVASDIASPTIGQTVTFTASVAYDSSYPAGSGFRSTLFRYVFDFGDGTSTTTTGGVSVSTTKSYTAVGTYALKVVAQELSPGTPSKIQETGRSTLSVSPPTLTGDFTVNPSQTIVGDSISFTATVSGGTGPYSFTWDFGDETPTVTGNPVTHTYSSPGTYTVTVTATDTSGARQTFTRTVTLGQKTSPLQLEYVIALAAVAGAAAGLVFYFRKRKSRVESSSQTIQKK